jgi:hypothetical protein
MVFIAALLVNQADVMAEPGARISTTAPKLEYDANPSVEVVAPTVMASAVLAGVKLDASNVEFPAAKHMTIPSVMALLTAASSVADVPIPPRDILPTAGLVPWCEIAQSIPAMI